MSLRQDLQCAALAVLVVLFVVCVTVVSLALGKDANKRAGILVLQLNVTSLVEQTLEELAPLKRSFIQSIESDIASAGGAIATAIPTILSQTQSVAAAAAAAATLLTAEIDSVLPKNISVGTAEFCIGFSHNVSCDTLPIKLSSIVSEDVQQAVGINLTSAHVLENPLSKVTPASIKYALIVGLVLLFIMILLSVASQCHWLSCFTSALLGPRICKAVFCFVFGLICCIPFVVPTVVLCVLKSKVALLPPWVHARVGDAYELFIGGLACVAGMTLLSTALQWLM